MANCCHMFCLFIRPSLIGIQACRCALKRIFPLVYIKPKWPRIAQINFDAV
jgi:hypothetical protein